MLTPYEIGYEAGRKAGFEEGARRAQAECGKICTQLSWEHSGEEARAIRKCTEKIDALDFRRVRAR